MLFTYANADSYLEPSDPCYYPEWSAGEPEYNDNADYCTFEVDGCPGCYVTVAYYHRYWSGYQICITDWWVISDPDLCAGCDIDAFIQQSIREVWEEEPFGTIPYPISYFNVMMASCLEVDYNDQPIGKAGKEDQIQSYDWYTHWKPCTFGYVCCRAEYEVHMSGGEVTYITCTGMWHEGDCNENSLDYCEAHCDALDFEWPIPPIYSNTNISSNLYPNANCKIIPNPNEGVFSIKFTSFPANEYTMIITDLEGKFVNDYSIRIDSKDNIYQINDFSHPAGVYIYTLYNRGQMIYSGKISIQ